MGAVEGDGSRTAGARFLDYLPSVLRQADGGGLGFLGRLLAAYETVFATVEAELDAIPELFAVPPAPVLAADTPAGALTLPLDSAAGLGVGDVLQLDDDAAEIVEVAVVAADLAPTTVTLRASLRLEHRRGTVLRVLGSAAACGTLAAPVPAGDTTLTLAGGREIAAGAALRLGAGAAAEYAHVAAVAGPRLTLARPLASPHAAGEPVALLAPPQSVTPPAAFASAVRDGAEWLLRAAARAGERAIELDTCSGLEPGDLLHLRESDPARVELVRVEFLPTADSSSAIKRAAVRLEQPLRFDHAPGLGLALVERTGSASALADAAAAGATALTVDHPDALGAAPGDLLQVGTGGAEEHVQVLASAGATLSVTPSLLQPHAAGQPLALLVPRLSGAAHLAWLAGWIGLALRPDRGEQWNRELLRLAGAIGPRRGTRAGVEAFVNAYLRGEAHAVVVDPAQPLQVGLVATVGADTVVCGGPPHWFWIELTTEAGNSTLRQPAGLAALAQAARAAADRERPAHTAYSLRIHAPTLQLGVDALADVGARVGETTALWAEPLVVQGEP